MRRFALCLTLVTLACQPDATVGGDGTITGKLDGRPYDTVGAAYVIGHPDDPAQTAVIYVFDAPVGCDELSSPGWDERVADNVQSLELKLIGHAPGDYPVALDGRPSSGESSDNYTLTSTSGVPSEVSASGGNVHLDNYVVGTGAAGSFDLQFSGGSVKGTFEATWCAGGHEP